MPAFVIELPIRVDLRVQYDIVFLTEIHKTNWKSYLLLRNQTVNKEKVSPVAPAFGACEVLKMKKKKIHKTTYIHTYTHKAH